MESNIQKPNQSQNVAQSLSQPRPQQEVKTSETKEKKRA